MTNICQELGQNFLEYSYETNSNRAFPDVRDGLKPGARAVLWEMWSKGYTSNKPHVKSAKVSGGVAALYWPHGTTSIYETFVHMSQNWINNLPLVDWHGNNGNKIIGDFPASDRYTECRLSSAVEEGMFVGINKNNVPMILNFSEDEEWPEVLPSIIPTLLLNGSQGIGVTIANCWTNFSLKDSVNVINKYLDTGEVDTKNFYPDYPSGGVVINKDDIHTIHETGKGKVVIRGKVEIKGNSICITELPYQVYVEPFLTSVKELIQKDEINGIDDILNKSERNKILIEIKCSSAPASILNKLYASTELQKTINVNQMGLISKTPTLFTLKEYLKTYVEHNLLCIEREHQFDLDKANSKIEIVKGLIKAVEDIDNIITLIKTSKSSADAVVNLINKYDFTEVQAKAIVDMKLGKLANVEKIQLNKELEDLTSRIEYCGLVISSREKQKEIFKERLNSFAVKYFVPRRTQVVQLGSEEESSSESAQVVYIEDNSNGLKRSHSNKGFEKRLNDTVTLFTTSGRAIHLQVKDIPDNNKWNSYYSLTKEKIAFSEFAVLGKEFICLITKKGLIKKIPVSQCQSSFITLNEGDEVVSIFGLNLNDELIVITKNGMLLRFNSNDVNPSGKTAKGVKAISFKEEDDYILYGGTAPKKKLTVLFDDKSKKDFTIDEFNCQKRAGKGKKLGTTALTEVIV